MKVVQAELLKPILQMTGSNKGLVAGDGLEMTLDADRGLVNVVRRGKRFTLPVSSFLWFRTEGEIPAKRGPGRPRKVAE